MADTSSTMLDDAPSPPTTVQPTTVQPNPLESDPLASDVPSDIPSTWEDDETSATLFLRSAFTLLAGSFLVWAQISARILPAVEWNRWVWLSVVANLLLPLGIAWMFFGQGLSRLEWLRDQKYNAWSYGWDFRGWRRHLKWTGLMFLPMLGIMLVFGFLTAPGAEARAYYRTLFLPPVTDARSLLWVLGTLTVYLFCWEWFFRGFLLFGMAQSFGPLPAIVLQAIVFGLAHYGKPPAEMYSAFAGGLILGGVAWHEQSFAPAFYTHALVHVVWVILVLL